jgi:hypothetical protein
MREVVKAKHKPNYKYGVHLPDLVKSFVDCDVENSNPAWEDANKLEIELLDVFNAFDDQGYFTQ